MKISIITACLNNQETIKQCLDSVASQTYSDIEHIVIDGKSTDNSLKIIGQYKHIAKIISQKDSGVYFALNKGISISQGEIIGFVHADDFLSKNNIIEKIAQAFTKDNELDAIYGDLEYISADNKDKKIRYWKSEPFSQDKIQKGWMPPQPTFYARKKIYDKFGVFDTKFKISADYDLMLRFLSEKIKTLYIPEVIVKMRIGGISNKNLKNIIQKSREDFLIIKKNKAGNLKTLINKNLSKITQFIK